MSMWVSIPLKKVDGYGTYQLRLDLGDAAQQVSRVEQRSTVAAVLGYLDEKARADEDLSEEHMQSLRYRQDGESSEAQVEGTEHCESIKPAELMGRRLRDIGDEFMSQIYRDPQLSTYVDSMMNETGEKSAAQNAFEHFCEVVNILLNCDETGAGIYIHYHIHIGLRDREGKLTPPSQIQLHLTGISNLPHLLCSEVLKLF